jgi:hypothetical protein
MGGTQGGRRAATLVYMNADPKVATMLAEVVEILAIGGDENAQESLDAYGDETPGAIVMLAEVAEPVAAAPCELGQSIDDPQSECRKVWPDSADDWCLTCLAREAMAEYHD